MDPKLLEKVATDAIPCHMPGLRDEVVAYKIPYPKGHVTMELRDEHSGKVVDRQEGDNFHSIIYGMHLRSWQRTLLGIVYSGGAGIWRRSIFFPNQFVAAWNQTNAESAGTEHRVITDGNGLIAFAARAPTAVGSGSRRGQPNVTESSYNATSETMVYDWPTSAGNGTFQSIGYTAINAGDTVGRLGMRASLVDRRYSQLSVKLGGAGGVITSFSSPITGVSKVNTAGDLIIPVYDPSSAAVTFVSLASGWRGTPGSYDEYNEGLLTYGGTLSAPTPVAMSAVNGTQPCFLGEQGSRYWIATVGSGNTVRLRGCNKTTLAVEITGNDTPAGSSTPTGVGCIIGSNAFVAPTTGSTVNTVYRYDLTAGTPNITATITLTYPSGMTPTGVTDLITDGTDLIAHTSTGTFRFNTSGVCQEIYGLLNASSVNETMASPFTGTGGMIGLPYQESISLTRWNGGSSTYSLISSTNDFQSPTQPSPFSRIAWYDGKLHVVGTTLQGATLATQVLYAWAEAGWNLGSRILLGSPSTKTSSQTMKITYAITLPDI